MVSKALLPLMRAANSLLQSGDHIELVAVALLELRTDFLQGDGTRGKYSEIRRGRRGPRQHSQDSQTLK